MIFPAFPEFEYGEDSCATQMPVQSLGNIDLEICVQLEDGARRPTDRQLEVLKRFNLLSPVELAEEIAVAARGYYRELDEEFDLSGEGIQIDEHRIERHYQYVRATIPQHKACRTSFVMLDMRCDWEEEHGMHILLLDGHVAYCGSCSTLFLGKPWKQIIGMDGEDDCAARLNELLTAVSRR